MKQLFFVIVILVYFSLVGFAVWSVTRLLPISARAVQGVTAVGTVLLTLLMVFTILPLLDRLPFPVAVAVYQTGNTLFIGALLTALFFLLLRLLSLFRLFPADWLRASLPALAVYAVAIVALFAAGYLHYMNKQRVELKVHTQKTVSPVRLVMVSDLHLGYHNRRAEARRWVQLINAEQPDAVVIVGDLVDHSVHAILAQNIPSELRQLRAPVYMVPGNHEYMAGLHRVEPILSRSGITLLRDSVVSVGGVALVGRDDLSNRSRLPLRELMARVPHGQPAVVLDHQPYAVREAEREGAALQLSGHTHNGQVWPASWIVRLVYENAYGSRRFGRTLTYVSSGLGVWGAKVRLGSDSEYVVVDID